MNIHASGFVGTQHRCVRKHVLAEPGSAVLRQMVRFSIYGTERDGINAF